MAMLNPISTVETEVQFQAWLRDLATVANAAENLAEWGDTNLTTANLQGGGLIKGYDATGLPIVWTPDELIAAQSLYQLSRAFSNWMRTKPTNGKSPMQIVQGNLRAIQQR